VRVVVAGASGFVGRKLVTRLAEAGHDVLALSRHPDPKASFDNVEFRAVDVGDSEDLQSALSGAEAAYYLIHSMAGKDFVWQPVSPRRRPEPGSAVSSTRAHSDAESFRPTCRAARRWAGRWRRPACPSWSSGLR
jgi:NAD(P)-dependent dehydrogenase (short-subunit alcohol dehydrogenase family)